MFEFVMIGAVVVAAVKMCNADGRGSPGVWGSIAFLACLFSLVLPLPFVRVFLAGILVLGAMIAYNAWQASRPEKGGKINRSGRR